MYNQYKKKGNYTINPLICTLAILYSLFLAKKVYVINQSEALLNLIDYLEIPLYVSCVYHVIAQNKYSRKIMIWGIAISLIFMVVIYKSGLAELLKATVLVFSFKDNDFQRLARAFFHITIFMTLLTISLYILSISDAGIGRRGYLTYGFTGAGGLGQACFYMTLQAALCGYTKRKDLKTVLLIINCICFILSNNKTGIVLGVMTLFICNSKLTTVLVKKGIRKIIYILPLLMTSMTFVTTLLYARSPFIQRLDQILSGRISLNYRNFGLFGIKIFGQKANFYTQNIKYYNEVTKTYSTFNTIDNAYMAGFITMGILAMIVLYVCYIFLVRKSYQNAQINLLSIIAILCIYGLIESAMLSIYVSLPFFYLTASTIAPEIVDVNNKQIINHRSSIKSVY